MTDVAPQPGYTFEYMHAHRIRTLQAHYSEIFHKSSHKAARVVIVDGVRYASVIDAAMTTGIPYTTIMDRCRNRVKRYRDKFNRCQPFTATFEKSP